MVPRANHNGRRTEITSGLAEIPLVGASEEFSASPPPELVGLEGKDPADMLLASGYTDNRITELVFPTSQVQRRRTATPRVSTSSRKPKRTLPPELERLSYEEVERILDDSGYTKRQIAELGFRRFGVPEKFLLHSRKGDAVTSIRDAISNRRILDEISRQARKAGAARSA